jgi:cytochrome c peroxidase
MNSRKLTSRVRSLIRAGISIIIVTCSSTQTAFGTAADWGAANISDGRAAHLEEQARKPLQAPIEMNLRD